MSSDSTGEIYVITRTDGSGVNNVSRAPSTTGGNGTPSGTAPSPSASTGSAVKEQISKLSSWVAGAAAIAGAAMI